MGSMCGDNYACFSYYVGVHLLEPLDSNGNQCLKETLIAKSDKIRNFAADELFCMFPVF